jgi:hypothetical protein
MYIDLNWEVKTNAEFRYKLKALTDDIKRLEKETEGDPHGSDKIASRIIDIYRLCKYNAGLLVPYFFPQYPYDKPLSCSARPYSFAMFHMQIGGFLSIRAGRQIGKALEENEPVLTPRGYSPIKDLAVGDTVFDGKGKPTIVTGVFPQGQREIFRVTFTDGAYVDCDEEHLWLCAKAGRKFNVKTLKEIRARKGGDNPSSDQGMRIPLTAPVEFPAKEHYIRPYILGLLLGDGALTMGHTAGFTTADSELAEAFDLQEGVNLVHYANYGKRLNKDNKRHGVNPFRDELLRLDLIHTAEHKFVPKEYLFDSVENRIELLRGLLDTDGSIYGKCQIEFYSVSKQLAEDVQFLVHSLGGTARIKTKQGYYKKDGERINCKICYRVKIKIQDINPFKLKRKADKFYNIRYSRTRVIAAIRSLGFSNAICISVASPEKTFLTRDCIVTHNSTSFGARQLMYAHIMRKRRSMYIVPHQSFLDTYANRVREMERAFRFYQVHKDYRQNLKYKEYPNESVTMLVKCLTDTQEARSKTTDEALFDECQLLDPDFLPDIEQCQKASRMPTTIYAGTSTTTDSLLETKFLESSQAAWLIRAPGYHSNSVGQGWLNCSDKDDILKAIQPQGLTNPASGKVIDVTDGRFVHQIQSNFEQGYLGFHIPQIIIPDYANIPQKWMEIWNAFQSYDIKKFLQEILGIPTEEGMREITTQDLKNMCVLPETPETLKQIAGSQNNRYKYTVSGCDWGGSDYNPATKTKVSYTVHAILGICWDGSIEILHIRQYSGMDYRSISNQICDDHKAYNCVGIASDFGVGAAYNMLLRENPIIRPERHFIFGYVGPQAALIKAPSSGPGWFNQYSLNRTESITSLYQAIKNRRIRCYAWELAQERLSELLNLYRVPTETVGGNSGFRYQRHGSKADDTLHAINFAFCLARIILNEPILEDPALTQVFRETFNPGQQTQFFNPHGGFDLGGTISG